MHRIDEEIDAGSYEWLTAHWPRMIDAIQYHLHRSATPEQIRRHVSARVGEDREAFGLRCEQAARHMLREQSN